MTASPTRSLVPETALGAFGLIALVVGIAVLPAAFAFDPVRTLDAVLGQLPHTVPSIVLVTLAGAANLGTAGLLLLSFAPETGRSPARLVLGAWGATVLLDVGLLYVLGWLGVFVWPVVAAIHVALLALALVRGRPPRPRLRLPRAHLGWGLVAVAWSAPLLLSLASPVVPFMDVLPNHVAPVEHVRTFGQFDPLTTTPSPIYGPSRLSMGYVGVLSTVSTASGVPAAQAVSAFAALQIAIMATAVAGLATTVADRSAVWWALLAFAMAQPFARLPDDRAHIIALPIVAWALVELLEVTRRDPGRALHWPLVVAVGATLLMHAVIGAYLWFALLLLVVARPARYRVALPALASGAVLALPQAAVMLGIELSGIVAASTLPLAGVAAWLVARPRLSGILVWLGRASLIVAAVVAAAALVPLAAAFAEWIADFADRSPLLVTTGVIGLAGVAHFRPAGREVLLAFVGTGVIAGTLAHLVPADAPDLLWAAVRYQVPKEVHTWAPLALAISAAALLATLNRARHRQLRTRRWDHEASELAPADEADAPARRPARWLTANAVATRARAVVSHPRVRAAAILVVVAAAALPIRQEEIGPMHVGERHLAENVGIQLRYAQHGYWTGYPDSRWVVNADQREVLGVIREEIDAGRITPDTRLLHLADSFQQWRSIPVGVFTGVLETTVSPDARLSIHTVGGRLVASQAAASHLAAGYEYLLVEIGTDVELSQRVLARYEVIFATERAALLRCTAC